MAHYLKSNSNLVLCLMSIKTIHHQLIILLVMINLANSSCNFNGLILKPDYDIYTSPSTFGDHTVNVEIKFLNIYEIDDQHATMTLNLKIYLTWKESRIQINVTTKDG